MNKKLSAFWILPLASVVLLGGCNVTDLQQQVVSKSSSIQTTTLAQTATTQAKAKKKTEDTSIGDVKVRYQKHKKTGG